MVRFVKAASSVDFQKKLLGNGRARNPGERIGYVGHRGTGCSTETTVAGDNSGCHSGAGGHASAPPTTSRSCRFLHPCQLEVETVGHRCASTAGTLQVRTCLRLRTIPLGLAAYAGEERSTKRPWMAVRFIIASKGELGQEFVCSHSACLRFFPCRIKC
jgi:hypothetical protein